MHNMSIKIQKNGDGTYRIHHRPLAFPGRAAWLDGPVFFRPVRGKDYADLLHLQFGMGSGPWIVMARDYLTGKAHSLRGTGINCAKREEAVAALCKYALQRHLYEVPQVGHADVATEVATW